mmetsp:Transcript_20356/g.17658  ORF Transcript_20356/g.17658 Transcript_20356/m.17658 type:complete len:91 (+) Transcript_20356:528-800(+)
MLRQPRKFHAICQVRALISVKLNHFSQPDLVATCRIWDNYHLIFVSDTHPRKSFLVLNESLSSMKEDYIIWLHVVNSSTELPEFFNLGES